MDSKYMNSPSFLKAQQLTEKLANLQTGLENEQIARGEAYSYKTKQLEDKILKFKSDFDMKVVSSKEVIAKLVESSASEHMSLELLDEKKAKEFKLTETNSISDINTEKQAFKETHHKLEKVSEEKLFEIRLELNRERKMREDSEEHQIVSFTEDISKLQEAVDYEISNREGGYEKSVKVIGQELSRCYDTLEKQARAREDLHAGYSKLIEEVENAVRQELAKEKQERESVEETLIKLLEETCERVEQGFRRYY